AARRALIAGTPTQAARPNLGNKLAYFLGQATGSAHNIQRSTTMASQLSRIGLHNNPATRSYLAGHLGRVLNDNSSIVASQGSRVVRESLLSGPGGFVKWQ